MTQSKKDLIPYKKTPEFSTSTVPKGLLANHSTAKGGQIVVTNSSLVLHYEDDMLETVTVKSGGHAWVEPQQLHRVALEDACTFYVQFHKMPKTEG